MTTGKQWGEWIEELELQLRFLETSDTSKKKDLLMLNRGKKYQNYRRVCKILQLEICMRNYKENKLSTFHLKQL